MTCTGCTHAYVVVGGDDEPRVDCRRYPPELIVSVTSLSDVNGHLNRIDSELRSSFPPAQFRSEYQQGDETYEPRG